MPCEGAAALGAAALFPPDLFSDDDRMNVLYAPFRDRTLNPTGYDSKLRSWESAIAEYCRVNRQVGFKAEDLPDVFSRKGKKPACLDVVVAHLCQQNTLVPEDKYLTSLDTTDGQGWVSWGLGIGFDYLLKKPVSMTLNWVWSSVTSNSAKVKGDFVCPSAVEEMADDLYEFCCNELLKEKGNVKAKQEPCDILASGAGRRNKALDNAVEWNTVLKEAKGICPEERTLSILLALLLKQRKVTVIKIPSEGSSTKTLIHFGDHQRTDDVASPFPVAATHPWFPVAATHSGTEPKKDLTEKDKAVLKLEVTAKDLVLQIENLHSVMEKCQEVAKMYVAKGIRPLALNALKKKKFYQGQLASKEKSLENLELMISKLEDVDSDKMVFSAYKDAVEALNKSMGDLDVDTVDDTMDDMKELLAKQEEIATALSGKSLQGDEDEEQLETELELILNESTGKREQGEAAVTFPSIPVNDVDKLLEQLCISPVKRDGEKTEPELAF